MGQDLQRDGWLALAHRSNSITSAGSSRLNLLQQGQRSLATQEDAVQLVMLLRVAENQSALLGEIRVNSRRYQLRQILIERCSRSSSSASLVG